MGQVVFDNQSQSKIFFPDDTSSDEIQRSVSDYNNGAISEHKSTLWDNIKDTIQKTTGNYDFDPVMTAKSTVAGLYEGIAPLVQVFDRPKPTSVNPNLINIEPSLPKENSPVTTPYENDTLRKVSPTANFIGDAVGQLGSFFAVGGAVGEVGGILSKVPQVMKFMDGINAAKEAGVVSEAGINAAKGAAGFGATTATYGGLQSEQQQKEIYGDVQVSDVAKESINQGLTGLVTGGVLSSLTKPLMELGVGDSYLKEFSKRMLASGTVMGATTAVQGGSPRDVTLATLTGALFPLVHAHGEIQEVNQSVLDTAKSIHAAYFTSQTGMDYSTALQIAHENILNQAESAIHDSMEKALKTEGPQPVDQRTSASKVFTDPYDPQLFDHLSQFISPYTLVRMDSEQRLWLSNQPLKDLNAYGELHKETAFDEAKSEAYIRQPDSAILEDDARRARGIPVDKTALDEVSKSKELTENVLAKTANNIVEASGKSKATPGAKVEIPKNKEVPGGEQKTTKVAEDINSEFVNKGFKSLNEDEQSRFSSINMKEQEQKVSDIMNDRQRVNNILDGQEELPKDVHPTIFYRGVEQRALAENDFTTGKKLAESSGFGKELSLAAQTMRGSQAFDTGGLNKVDPIKEIKDANKILKTKAPKDVAKQEEKIVKDIKETVKKAQPKISDWDKFLKEIAC